jgi:ElaB/YqjD/DUF883 family membrane-anchored ribosome-binding protein
MSTSDHRDRIARLQKELERLSAEHSEMMAKRSSSASPRIRKLDVARGEALSRRIRQLKESLRELRRDSPAGAAGKTDPEC